MRERYLALSPERLKGAHLRLADHARDKWRQYEQLNADKLEAARFDTALPTDEVFAAHGIREEPNGAARYKVALAALDAGALAIPPNIRSGYDGFHALYRKYVLGEVVDDWRIVELAAGVEEDPSLRETLIAETYEFAIHPWAWGFNCPNLYMWQIKRRFDAAWPKEWTEFPSDSKPDSLGTQIVPGGWLRIWEFGNRFIANIGVKDDAEDRLVVREAVENYLLEKILPLIEAENLMPREPYDVEG